jgi:hypothetical protein
MNNRLLLYLFQMRAFWRLRGAMTRVFFWAEARIFAFRYGVKEENINYRSLRHIFIITQKPLLFAVGVAVLLQYVDPFLYPYYRKLKIGIPDNSTYVTFLATVGSIGGIFIGLYYAGISAVSSAIYARVPNNVRDLLAQERVGNVYLRFLSFLTSLSLMLISFCLLSQPKIFLAIPIVAVFAGIGIIAFVKLGQRAFYLFDPTKLSDYIFDQMQHWLGMVKGGGFRWLDKSFQNHAHRQASTILDTLETLTDITAKEPHLSGKPFIILSQNILRFLIHYEYVKRYIPTESAWYEQRYQHRDWYRTEDSHVAIAYQTGTTLQPVVTNNKEWVEERVIPILMRCIKVNLAQERYLDALSLLGYFEPYSRRLALEGRSGKAFALLKDLASAILSQLTAQTDGALVKEEGLEKLSIAERVASLPISVALGYREKLEILNRRGIEKLVSNVRWENDASIYRQDFPAYCLERLEWFRPRLAFEKEVEDQFVTPRWYLSELVCQVEAEHFADNTKALVLEGTHFYNSFISQALSSKRPWIAAAIMSREWEYWHKIGDQIDMWSEKWADLISGRRIEGLPWAEFDIDKLRTNSDGRQEELLKSMSEHNLFLALLTRPEGYPDFAGQFLHTTGEVAFDALLANDIALLKSVFQRYLFGCLMRYDSLRPKSVSMDWWVQQDFKIAAAALLDVMDVSGYAKLLADYHGNDALWNEVTTAWNNYLAQQHDHSPIPLLAGAVAFTEAAFEIPHRGVLRTTWKQKINWKLKDVPRHEAYRRGILGSYTVIDHESALVRIFAKDPFGSFYDGIDVFIEFYLRSLDSAKDVDFGRKRRNMKDSMEREERQRKTKKDDDEAED